MKGQSRRAQLEADLASIRTSFSLPPLGKLESYGERSVRIFSVEVVEYFGAQRSNDLYGIRFSFPGKFGLDLVSQLFRESFIDEGELKVTPTEMASEMFKMEVGESRMNLLRLCIFCYFHSIFCLFSAHKCMNISAFFSA